MDFISYNQIADHATIAYKDPGGVVRRETISTKALKDLLATDNFELSETLKRLKNDILDAGGMEWLQREIRKYQSEIVDGERSLIIER
jgi:hypothetical protein